MPDTPDRDALATPNDGRWSDERLAAATDEEVLDLAMQLPLAAAGLALYYPATHVAVSRESADFLLGMMKFAAYPDDDSANAAFGGRFATARRELGGSDA